MPDQSAPAADDAFGADLYRLLSEQGSDVVFSPVSVASVLQMALCGARGQTAALPLRPDFTARLGAAVAEADFAGAPQQARAQINRVIAEQTEEKITGLLPARAIDDRTRLVLTSAIYLR